MQVKATRIPYRQTGAFSGLVLDYIDQLPEIRSFQAHMPGMKSIEAAIKNRNGFTTNREQLVIALQQQYTGLETAEAVKANIERLRHPECYTITTAHQNNIFTGPLYFIYKILHVINIARKCAAAYPDKMFVPVYYMGSEDADLDELNHITVNGEKLRWETVQQGAVGRMKTDKSVTALINRMEGMLAVLPHGAEIIALFRKHYTEGKKIQDATFHFVDALFSRFGLVVLIPDNSLLKQLMIPVFRDELLQSRSASLVKSTNEQLAAAGYKVQASGRDINLFYLKDDLRNRIERTPDGFRVVDTDIRFSEAAILQELEQYPERFSPNVILRGVFQETILPDIAFVGGGGETAYWLQLKALFDYYQVPYPMLVLRNSFMLLEQKWKLISQAMDFQPADLFLSERHLLERIIEKKTPGKTSVQAGLDELHGLYARLKEQAGAVDSTLKTHVEALETNAKNRLAALGKKMLRAEKRKYITEQQRIAKLKAVLFPGDGLQERTENISYFYAKWGSGFLDQLLEHSLCFEQEFVILEEG